MRLQFLFRDSYANSPLGRTVTRYGWPRVILGFAFGLVALILFVYLL